MDVATSTASVDRDTSIGGLTPKLFCYYDVFITKESSFVTYSVISSLQSFSCRSLRDEPNLVTNLSQNIRDDVFCIFNDETITSTLFQSLIVIAPD